MPHKFTMGVMSSLKLDTVRLLSHIGCVAAAVYLTGLQARTAGVTQRLIGQDFARAFFPDGFTKYNGDAADNPQARYFLFTRDEFVESVSTLLQRYRNLPYNLIIPAIVAGNVSKDVPLPLAYWSHYVNPFANTSAASVGTAVTDTIIISDSTQPFPLDGANANSLDNFFATTITITYDLRFRLNDPMPNTDAGIIRGCSDWATKMTYSMQGRGHFEVTWAFERLNGCSGAANAGVQALTNAALFIAVIYSFATVFCGATIAYAFIFAMRCPSNQTELRTTHRLTWLDSVSLVRLFDVCALSGSVLVAAHCGAVLTDSQENASTSRPVLLGLASSLLWISLLDWVSFSPRFYATVLTLHAALPKIVLFLAGALPIFVSFCIFALCIFGRHAVRYSNGVMSFMTLFAFINGDALTEIYTHTQGTSPPASLYWAKMNMGEAADWWTSPSLARGGWAYGLSFFTVVGDLHLVAITFVFMYVVLNCIVGLVEEAFFMTRDGAGGQLLLQQIAGQETRVRKIVADLNQAS